MVLKLSGQLPEPLGSFENDVKMYGTQTLLRSALWEYRFENDVKMYGTQTGRTYRHTRYRFENDVKMYGTQTRIPSIHQMKGLRMM